MPYPSPNGLSFDNVPKIGFCLFVFTTGSSRLDHPKSFILSRKELFAMCAVCVARVEECAVWRLAQ